MTQQLIRRALAACLAAVLAAGACGRKIVPPQNAAEQAAVDSLVRLMRKSLSEKDPGPTMQAISCAVGSMYRRFGELRGDELVEFADQHAYTWRDRGAKNRRDDALAGRWFSMTCVRGTDDSTAPARTVPQGQTSRP